MKDYEYPIPQYVESGTLLFKGSRQQVIVWLPFVVIAVILFFVLEGKMLRFCSAVLVAGFGHILAFQKVDRETFWELIVNDIRYRTKPKTLYWERAEEE
ncbi:hypothetical protein [Paenibacillus alvei]|uniref:hypothetical protein n=1 Tax=Paenibacillus alvei TaxID=44250 RepID=UPI00227DA48E|nr:hypothetical protein [Paenibacillus alvei]